MSALIAIESLLAERRLWRGKSHAAQAVNAHAQIVEDAQPVESASNTEAHTEPTGFAALDAVLPYQGWPASALIEILHSFDGMGELRLLLPTLARHTQAGRPVAVIAPPYLPNPKAWSAAGVVLAHLQIIDADPPGALWAAEQCLRSTCLAAVLCWPQQVLKQQSDSTKQQVLKQQSDSTKQVDDKILRRLQVAASTGGTLAFALRDQAAARHPSPAALRVQVEKDQLRILKCRGANAPTQAIALR